MTAMLFAIAALALLLVVLIAYADRERMRIMREDLRGNCKICAHYNAFDYIRCEGSCGRCKYRPGCTGGLDRWKWRHDN